jgi:hypothetical protein
LLERVEAAVDQLITRYAQRMLIENALSDEVWSFGELARRNNRAWF